MVYDANLYHIDGGRLFSLKNQSYPCHNFYDDVDFRMIGFSKKSIRYDELDMKPIEFDGVCVFNPNEEGVTISIIMIGYWKAEHGPLRGMELVEKFCNDRQIDAEAWQWAEF